MLNYSIYCLRILFNYFNITRSQGKLKRDGFVKGIMTAC